MNPEQLRELRQRLQLARVQVEAWQHWQQSTAIDRAMRMQSCDQSAQAFFSQLWACLASQLCEQYQLAEGLSHLEIIKELERQQIADWERGWLSGFIEQHRSIISQLEVFDQASLQQSLSANSSLSKKPGRISMSPDEPLIPRLMLAFEALCADLAQYGEEW